MNTTKICSWWSLLACLLFSGTLTAQTGQEYFVRQQVDEGLLVRINTFEAEFVSTITGGNGETLVTSGVINNRLAPVFQFIDPPERSRQLNISVTPGRKSNRSEFNIELTRLTVWDERSASLARAYRLLSFGLQQSDAVNQAAWTVRINALMDAARQFEQLGMREMRLWSNYFAAHQVYHRLHDHNLVIGMTRDILTQLKISRLQDIELATLQLRSAALIDARRAGTLQDSGTGGDPIQALLMQTARLAESMDQQLELAHTINISGAEFAARGSYQEALVQFQLAVNIADSLGEGELAKAIRERTVDIHSSQGDSPATGEVLREIESQLVIDGDGDELALNQLQQGRLLNREYRYPQAIAILRQALQNQNHSAIARQIYLELARSLHESGQLDAAFSSLESAGVSTVEGRLIRPDETLDMGEALGMMADIHRQRGELDPMNRARAAQADYHESGPQRAAWLYQRGLDALAGDNGDARRAAGFFTQSRQAAASTGQWELENLSLLRVCALTSQANDNRALCSDARVQAALDSLLDSGLPRLALEAMYLRARFLAGQSRRAPAIRQLERLVADMSLFRYGLNGVLGAWYWQRHMEIFDFYLGLSMTVADRLDNRRSEGAGSLLALSRIRYVEGLHQQHATSTLGDTADIRELLAQRATLTGGTGGTQLRRQIQTELDTLRTAYGQQVDYLSPHGLNRHLESLHEDEAVLTAHISRASAHLWLARGSKVFQYDIAYADELYRMLNQVRSGLENPANSISATTLDALGRRLLGPVANDLPNTLYWLPAGPLLGLPLDALRYQGRYLVERHLVVNMMRFPARPGPGGILNNIPRDRVFVAGHPKDYSGGYATRLDTSEDIRIVADMFVGPGLRIVQGAALLEDEFHDEWFRQADIIHLTMPGSIDLGSPDSSALQMSEPERGQGRGAFKPGNIRPETLQASLVFMSAVHVNGRPASVFRNRLPLVSDFLDIEAAAVVTSLWKIDLDTGRALVTDFYNALRSSGDISNALTGAKRRYLQQHPDQALPGWAALQLSIH